MKPLAPVAAVLVLLAGVAQAQPFVDTDGDGIADALDNCWQHANPTQLNADGDAYGDRCDPDYDNSGTVNFADLAQLKDSFFTFDPAVDLTGNGHVNFGDLAVMRAFFFQPPGPGRWLPPTSAKCNAFRNAARNACCPGYETNPPATSSVEIPTDCECSPVRCQPTDFVAMQCLPLASWQAGQDAQCPSPALVADDQGQGGDAECMEAIELAKNACGLSVDQHLELTGDIPGSQATVLPFCESLEDWKRDFTCDPYGKTRVGLTVLEKAQVGQSFEHAPEDGGWIPFADKPPVANPPVALAFPFSSPSDANEPIDLIRVEIPGNLVRHHLARAALAPTFAQMELDLEGVECRPDELRCSFDLLDMKDFSDQIEEGSAGTDDGVRYFVDETPRGYSIHGIKFTATDSQSLQLTAEYTGTVEIYAEGELVLDFEEDAYLGFLPLHDPRGMNGYDTSVPYPDSQANHLDRALVAFDITDGVCQQLGGRLLETPSGSEVQLNGSYHTFAGPYLCWCSPANPEQAWCVADAYPRSFHEIADRDDAGSGWGPQDFLGFGAKLHTVYCSSRDPLNKLASTISPEPLMADGIPLPLPPDFASSVVTAETSLVNLAMRYGLNSASRARLQEHVNEFACSSQYANRTAVGPLVTLTLNDVQMQVGPRVASAIGVQAAVQAAMPVLKVEVTPGILDIDVELGNSAERWLEDEWWTFPLGWLTQWFLEIFSNIASLVSTILINFVSPVSTVEFGDLQLLVHGMISHRTALLPVPPLGQNVANPEVSLGVRRVAMNLPDVDVTPLDLAPQWNSSSCDLGNAEDFVDWALSLFLCPLETVTNLARLAATPVLVLIKATTNLILDAAISPASAIMDQFIPNAAKLEDGNNLGKLLAQATRTQQLLPYYLAPGQTPATAPDALGVDLSGLTPAQAAMRLGAQLPPPFASLCLGANQASLTCSVAKIFLGGASPLQPQLDIVRMGAKTHYRSLGDIAPGRIPISREDYEDEGLSWDYPPVRYCVAGDRPPGSPAYGSDLLALRSPQDYLDFEEDTLLDDLTAFDDVEVSSSADATPTDWRAQCAAFADFKITTLYYVSRVPNPLAPGQFTNAQLLVQPTKRTNFLLNEVLFCENDTKCDPTIQNGPFRQRADLAACSVMADIWWRLCDQPACPDNPPYQSLLQDVTSSPTNRAWVQAILTRAAGQTSGILSQELAGLGTRLPQCVGDLQAAGYVIPPQLVQAP